MAAAPLRHGLIRIPPRTVGERALVNEPVMRACPPGADPATATVACSLEALPPMKSAWLVFDARDVALMRVTPPALPPAKLMRALPNMLEDRLLQEAHACAFVLGPVVQGQERLVAVIDRSWFEFVIGAIERRGIRLVAAWPAQLALAVAPGEWALQCADAGLNLRLGPWDGLGWAGGVSAAERRASVDGLIRTALDAGERPTGLRVMADAEDWLATVREVAAEHSLPVHELSSPPDTGCPIDLLGAREGSAGRRWLASVDWRAWRLPVGVALAAGVAAVVGLNLHWAKLSRERTELRQRMEATFRQAYPKAQVVVDPLLQMQRQTAELRLRAGQSGPDDFLPMLTRFTQAMGPGAQDALAALEYRDGRLKVRWRPGALDAARRNELRTTAERLGLKVQFDGDTQATVSVAG